MAGVAQQSGEKIGQQIIGGMVGVLDGGDIQSAGNEQHGTGAVSPASMTAQEWQNDQKPQVCRTFVFLTVDENSIDDQYQVKKQRLSFWYPHPAAVQKILPAGHITFPRGGNEHQKGKKYKS